MIQYTIFLKILILHRQINIIYIFFPNLLHHCFRISVPKQDVKIVVLWYIFRKVSIILNFIFTTFNFVPLEGEWYLMWYFDFLKKLLVKCSRLNWVQSLTHEIYRTSKKWTEEECTDKCWPRIDVPFICITAYKVIGCFVESRLIFSVWQNLKLQAVINFLCEKKAALL